MIIISFKKVIAQKKQLPQLNYCFLTIKNCDVSLIVILESQKMNINTKYIAHFFLKTRNKYGNIFAIIHFRR